MDVGPIYTLMDDHTGLGDTGETMIGRRIGNQIVFLSRPRFDPEIVLKPQVTLGAEAGTPIQDAVLGRSGAGRAVDYRGEPVLASWQPVPGVDWGFVTKKDVREVLKEIRGLASLDVATGAI